MFRYHGNGEKQDHLQYQTLVHFLWNIFPTLCFFAFLIITGVHFFSTEFPMSYTRQTMCSHADDRMTGHLKANLIPEERALNESIWNHILVCYIVREI